MFDYSNNAEQSLDITAIIINPDPPINCSLYSWDLL
jgi:hypothetical protein